MKKVLYYLIIMLAFTLNACDNEMDNMQGGDKEILTSSSEIVIKDVTVTIKIEDQSGNPISNVQVQYANQANASDSLLLAFGQSGVTDNSGSISKTFTVPNNVSFNCVESLTTIVFEKSPSATPAITSRYVVSLIPDPIATTFN